MHGVFSSRSVPAHDEVLVFGKARTRSASSAAKLPSKLYRRVKRRTVYFITHRPFLPSFYRLVGLVVKASASRAKVPGSNPASAGIFSGSSHTSDSKIGTPVATPPGAWRYRVSAGTGRPGVSIL